MLPRALAPSHLRIIARLCPRVAPMLWLCDFLQSVMKAAAMCARQTQLRFWCPPMNGALRQNCRRFLPQPAWLTVALSAPLKICGNHSTCRQCVYTTPALPQTPQVPPPVNILTGCYHVPLLLLLLLPHSDILLLLHEWQLLQQPCPSSWKQPLPSSLGTGRGRRWGAWTAPRRQPPAPGRPPPPAP
jgi:hypothetical protein